MRGALLSFLEFPFGVSKLHSQISKGPFQFRIAVRGRAGEPGTGFGARCACGNGATLQLPQARDDTRLRFVEIAHLPGQEFASALALRGAGVEIFQFTFRRG